MIYTTGRVDLYYNFGFVFQGVDVQDGKFLDAAFALIDCELEVQNRPTLRVSTLYTFHTRLWTTFT